MLYNLLISLFTMFGVQVQDYLLSEHWQIQDEEGGSSCLCSAPEMQIYMYANTTSSSIPPQYIVESFTCPWIRPSFE